MTPFNSRRLNSKDLEVLDFFLFGKALDFLRVLSGNFFHKFEVEIAVNLRLDEPVEGEEQLQAFEPLKVFDGVFKDVMELSGVVYDNLTGMLKLGGGNFFDHQACHLFLEPV